MFKLMMGLLPAVLLVSVVLTGAILKQAIKGRRMDVPNARSSHQSPTPHGGGLALVLAYLFGLGLLLISSVVSPVASLLGVVIATVALATVGYLDDLNGLSASFRLAVQGPAALLGIWAVGGAVPIAVLGCTLTGVFLPWLFALLVVLWLTNLTNFMDGIDGIAGTQAVLACSMAAGLAVQYGDGSSVILIAASSAALLAFASLGFLLWNWPPAKIFMGDVGSATLGLLFGIHAFWFAQADTRWFWVWMILLGVFIVDATFTLFVRLTRRQQLGQAHRSHAYQRASRWHGGHRSVTLAVIVLIVFWLFPWAVMVAATQISGELGIIVAYSPLLLLCIRYRAGMLDD